MKVIRFLGDVHGKYGPYKTFMKGCENSIQVGDMGVGFVKYFDGYDREYYPNPPYDNMVKGNHRFIRGNHDNPAVCKRHTQCIPDGHVEDNMMFIGGALSVDKEFRTENYNWWPDEELSYNELDGLITKYSETKPEIMVTHECPENVVPLLMNNFKRGFPSITRQAFEAMFNIHKPKLWIFGHWHRRLNEEIEGCRFVCLNELEWRDIDVSSCEVLTHFTE